MGTYDVVERQFRFSWRLDYLEWFDDMLAMVLTDNPQAVRLDSLEVGPCDYCQPHIFAAAQHEGIERSDAVLLVSSNAAPSAISTYAPSP